MCWPSRGGDPSGGDLEAENRKGFEATVHGGFGLSGFDTCASILLLAICGSVTMSVIEFNGPKGILPPSIADSSAFVWALVHVSTNELSASFCFARAARVAKFALLQSASPPMASANICQNLSSTTPIATAPSFALNSPNGARNG